MFPVQKRGSLARGLSVLAINSKGLLSNPSCPVYELSDTERGLRPLRLSLGDCKRLRMAPPRPEPAGDMKHGKHFQRRFQRSWLFSSMVTTRIATPETGEGRLTVLLPLRGGAGVAGWRLRGDSGEKHVSYRNAGTSSHQGQGVF